MGLFPPSVRNNTLYVIANVSDDKMLSCSFFGNPIPTVSWHHNFSHTRIYNDVNYEAFVITSKLYLKNLTWEDRGNVMCKSSNLLGSDEKTGYVNIQSQFKYFVFCKLCNWITIANNITYHITHYFRITLLKSKCLFDKIL